MHTGPLMMWALTIHSKPGNSWHFANSFQVVEGSTANLSIS